MMEITAVPFAAHNGIEIDENGAVFLPFHDNVKNHFNGVHAGAQFLLAESASGYYLLTAFPKLVGKVLPLLHESRIKYVKQAQGQLTSRVVLSEAEKQKFLQVLMARGRAVINVVVDVSDTDGSITCSGEFKWFVQLKDDEK
jgi:acyl-coenzyme A thioesterase PaaI-like protein